MHMEIMSVTYICRVILGIPVEYLNCDKLLLHDHSMGWGLHKIYNIWMEQFLNM